MSQDTIEEKATLETSAPSHLPLKGDKKNDFGGDEMHRGHSAFSFFVARRYLFSKKKTHAINVISLISVIGVAVATMALVIVLSVFNEIGRASCRERV